MPEKRVVRLPSTFDFRAKRVSPHSIAEKNDNFRKAVEIPWARKFSGFEHENSPICRIFEKSDFAILFAI